MQLFSLGHLQGLINKFGTDVWNKISNAERDELSDLSLVMGKIANYDLYKDGLRIAKQYKSMDTLKSLDP